MYNRIILFSLKKNRTFDEKCSTIYPNTGGQHYEQRKPDTALGSMPYLQRKNRCEDIRRYRSGEISPLLPQMWQRNID